MTFFCVRGRWLKDVSLAFFLSVAMSFLAQPAFSTTSANLKSCLQKSLGQGASGTFAPAVVSPRSFSDLQRIYRAFSGQLFWVDAEGPTDKAWILVGVLRNSLRHGLSPSRYHIPEIFELLPSGTPQALAQLELLLTQGLVRYAQDLMVGVLPRSGSSQQAVVAQLRERPDALAIVAEAMGGDSFEAYLQQLAPRHGYYRRLQQALAHYRNIEESGGWPRIPLGPPLRPGDTDSRINAVTLRLLKTDWPENQELSSRNGYYNSTLRRAVTHFQRRHGLRPDGVLGDETIAAMNVPVTRRIEILRLNLLRWHGLAHRLGERYVLVNIASCTLAAVDGGEVVLAMPVVVGKQETQTPMFSDRIQYLVFNPYWTITKNIARTEELPALRKNPRHLVSRHVRLFSSWLDDAIELDSTLIDWYTVTPDEMTTFRLRQDPGPWNSLGKLKFVSRNRYAVFLHDTPTPEFFDRKRRTGSHGCVWVSKPPAMAGFFLENQKKTYSATEILTMYRDDRRVVVPLNTPVPFHLAYQTVQVDKRGEVFFTGDVYGHDNSMRHYLYDK